MSSPSVWSRAVNYYKRNSAHIVYGRPFAIRTTDPLISFTFDDFPQTALHAGGAILKQNGVRGTYYVSMGLLGKDSPSGPICVAEDLAALLDQGHELGCHTFSHCHAWNTKTPDFEESIHRNREALQTLFPGNEFRSLSYPISEPRPRTKRRVAKHFLCCRAGGQTLNSGTTDLDQLSSFFIEQSCGLMQPIRDQIDRNRDERGWLIFSTHDVRMNPSRYGCTPEFLERVVEYALGSGARILPVVGALEWLQQMRWSSVSKPIRGL